MNDSELPNVMQLARAKCGLELRSPFPIHYILLVSHEKSLTMPLPAMFGGLFLSFHQCGSFAFCLRMALLKGDHLGYWLTGLMLSGAMMGAGLRDLRLVFGTGQAACPEPAEGCCKYPRTRKNPRP